MATESVPFHPEATQSLYTFSHDPSLEHSSTSNTVTKTVLARHSTRVFHKDRRVPPETMEECLKISQYAPSSTNLQPWRITVTAGEPLERLRAAMIHAASSGLKSQVPPIPEAYRHFRSELGHELYGVNGYNIERSDREGQRAAQMRNYAFFDAPCVVVVGIDRSLAAGDILSVGLYLQTLILLLTERGLGTCAAVSTAGYPDVIREHLGVKDDVMILCTLAVGYEDESQHVNLLKMQREEWKTNIKFVYE